MFNKVVNFRAPQDLIAMLGGECERTGASLSAVIRDALSAKLVGAQSVPPSADLPSFHDRAANGDGEAFSAIAAAHYKRAEDGTEPAVIALARAVEFGRLAAIRGGRQERVTFLYLLEEHSHALRDAGMDALGDIAQGEAFALAEHMANDGDEEIGDMLVRGAGEVEPGVLLIARDLMALETS